MPNEGTQMVDQAVSALEKTWASSLVRRSMRHGLACLLWRRFHVHLF